MKTKFSNLIMPSRILFYLKLIQIGSGTNKLRLNLSYVARLVSVWCDTLNQRVCALSQGGSVKQFIHGLILLKNFLH